MLKLLKTRAREWRRLVRDRLRLARGRRNRAAAKAKFIGVTGSSGKSSTTALISSILQQSGPVRTQLITNGFRNLVGVLQRPLSEERFVVVESGVSEPGQMERRVRLLRPDVAVVTMIGLEHYSAFRSKDAVALEKGFLVEALSADGLAVLNADDAHVLALARRTSARTVTFGWSEGADYRVESAELCADGRLSVTLRCGSWRMTVETGLAAEHFAVMVAAAVACCRELGATDRQIADGCRGFSGLPGRFEDFRTDGGPRFIIDTTKAPNGTLAMTFESFSRQQAPRKWIVLGQISDFPGNPKPKYRDAYRGAREAADRVIFVGEHSHRSSASVEDRRSGRFVAKDRVRDVLEHLRENAGPSDVILLKSSANLHLERIALGWDGDVRCWNDHCGVSLGCRECGLFGQPYEEHRQARRDRRHARKRKARFFWSSLLSGRSS